MQSTQYVSDEIQQQHFGRGQREVNSLEAHTRFAEEALGESTRLVGTGKRQPVWHDLLQQAERHSWRWFVWALEVMVLLFVVLAFTMEVWGACPFEMGLQPVCQYCYSRTFLAWNLVHVTFWFYNLYMFLLLVSRGFVIRVSDLASVFVENEAKGVPLGAVSTYLYLTAILLFWEVIGVFVLVLSGSCDSSGTTEGRSELMFYTTMISIVCAPILLLGGRLDY